MLRLHAHQSEGLSLFQDDAMIDELAAQHIASSVEVFCFFGAERLSRQPPQQVSPSCACISALHFCFAQVSAALYSGPH